MDSYFYSTARLPLVSFDGSEYDTTDAFLEETAKWLSPGQQGQLSGCSIETVVGGLVDSW